jgi:hypothetical protein
MMNKFAKVRKNLYRGAAPSTPDLISLKKNFGVQKVISLDASVGESIAPICKKLGMDHVIIDIDPSTISSLKNLLKYNIYDLIDPKVCTFVHCLKGKDRTGLLIALVRCLSEQQDCKSAIKEAKKFGFGTGIDFNIEKFYIKLICKACNDDHTDSNHVYDIVMDSRDSMSEYRDSTMDPYALSWAPYADASVRTFPYASVNLTEHDEHGATREEYGLKGIKEEVPEPKHVPLVGVYDQNTQITNVIGPSLVGGGFV